MSTVSPIAPLEASIEELIAAYKEMREILDVQIKAVVRNDIDGINEGTEKQMAQNARIQMLETSFKLELDAAIAQHAPTKGLQKFSELIDELPEERKRLTIIREELIFVITRTQHKQDQLVSLLEFARKHTTETLRAIHAMGNQKSARYNGSGKMTAHQNQSIAINQTA